MTSPDGSAEVVLFGRGQGYVQVPAALGAARLAKQLDGAAVTVLAPDAVAGAFRGIAGVGDAAGLLLNGPEGPRALPFSRIEAIFFEDAALASRLAAAARSALRAARGAAAISIHLTARAPERKAPPTDHSPDARADALRLPLPEALFEIRTLALFRADAHGPHPRRAVELRNASGATLGACDAALYANGAAAAHERVPVLAPGGRQLIEHGLAEEVTVRADGPVARPAGEPLDLIYPPSEFQTESWTYVVDNSRGGHLTLLIEHTADPGRIVRPPAEVVEERDGLRLILCYVFRGDVRTLSVTEELIRAAAGSGRSRA